jgi:ATP-dependent RNA circularization protein (DNA/RNA ligase family)
LTTLTIQAENSSILNEIFNYLKSFGEKIEVIKSDDISKDEYIEILNILNNSQDNEIVESSRKSFSI